MKNLITQGKPKKQTIADDVRKTQTVDIARNKNQQTKE